MAKVIDQKMGKIQTQDQQITQRLFSGIVETLIQEGRIKIPYFGVFEIKKREPRQARDPRTGKKGIRAGKAPSYFQARPGDGRKSPSVPTGLLHAAKVSQGEVSLFDGSWHHPVP
jgi:nucleoid DNA-binding protein